MRCEVILCIFAAALVFFSPIIQTAKASDKCDELLRNLLNNPPKNTKIQINTRLNKARYSCHKGFKLVGKPEQTCKEGRGMKKKQPKCLTLVSCGKPEDIPHANFSGSSFTVYDKLSYRCENGYKLRGLKKRTCQEDGKWSKAPTCSPPCGKPEDIPHANFSGSSFNFNDKLRYTCEKGYKLRGPKRRTCGKPQDGKWSKAPTCAIIRCSNAENVTIKNGSVTTSDPEYVFGTTLAFECNDGYEIKRSGTSTCTEFGWRPPLTRYYMPYCKEKGCPDPGRPESGDRYGSFKVGSIMRFSCQFGFDLHGSRERKCMENFEWDGSLTTCQDGLTDCPVLGTPISGRKYGSEYNLGDIVNFECDDGFVLKGSAVRKCLDNGTWNGTEAICKDELEDRFKDVNTTAFILRKGVIDTLLEYTCNSENQAGCNKTNDARGRAINLNDKSGLDLVFVIDASSSVKRDGFELGLNFSQELVTTIGTSDRADGTRIALVTFGTEAKVEFNLGDAKVNTLEKAIDAIGKVKYAGGATASALALQKVGKVVVPNSDRGNKRAMMFITDGMSNIGGPPEKEAEYLKDKENFEIYAIGVGKNVKVRELMAIASADEDDNHVISVRKYGSLQQAIKKAVELKIDYSICGESRVDLRARIVGGKNSKRGWWPWQIGIYKQNNKLELELICGGSLISPRWILTAAHCFYAWHHFTHRNKADYDNAGKYAIRAGDHNLTKEEKSEQIFIPEQIYVHQDYQRNSYVNDIALVKLGKEVNLGKFVRTVCLPEKDEGDLAIPTKYGIATGWGATKPLKPGKAPEKADRHPKVLQYSAYTIQSDQLCSNKSAISINSTVSFCAGDGKGGNDTCKGDSGGAFVREGKRGDGYRWVATGIVSWGNGCAQKDEYGYYTRVYPFIDWIKKTIDEKNA